MTCQEAERMVTPYIKNELTGAEMEVFLGHLESCNNCQEELEIYFMVDVGIRELDGDAGAVDIAGALKARIEDSYGKVSRMWVFRTLKYAVTTLMTMALALMILLQFRIWLF